METLKQAIWYTFQQHKQKKQAEQMKRDKIHFCPHQELKTTHGSEWGSNSQIIPKQGGSVQSIANFRKG